MLFVGMSPGNDSPQDIYDANGVATAGSMNFGSTPPGSTVGGMMDIDVEITLGPNTALGSEVMDMRLRLSEEPGNEVTHEPAENHADILLDLKVNTPVWTKWRKVPNSNPTRWKYVESNVQIHGSSDEWYTYTYSRPWDTTRGFSSSDRSGANTKVWGHNGPYKLQVLEVGEHSPTPPYANYNTGSLKWQKIPQSGPAQQMSLDFPDPFKVNVHNLVIKNVTGNGTSSFVGKDENGNDMHVVDYIKFDPFNENGGVSNPKISFTVEDKGAPGRYGWYIWIRGTDETGWYTYSTLSGILPQPGRKDVIINAPASPDTQDNLLDKWGTYAFDLRVVKLGEHDVAGDTQDLRSDKISIPATMPGVTNEDGLPRKGHEVEGWATADEDFKWYTSYYLQSNRDASKMKVEFLDPSLQVKSTLTQPLTQNTPHLDNLLHVPVDEDEAGDWRGIFVPVDAHKDQYRDHNNKAMLAVNQARRTNLAANFAAASDIPTSDSVLLAKLKQRRIGYFITASPPKNRSYLVSLPSIHNGTPEDAGYWMQNSRIVFYSSHGNAGGTTTARGKALFGKVPSGTRINYQQNDREERYVEHFNLKGVRAVIYQSCQSSKTDTELGRGNLANETVKAGADYATGFNIDVWSDKMPQHGRHLWQALCLGKLNPNGTTSSPATLYQALEYAGQKIENDYSGEAGSDTFSLPNFNVYSNTNPAGSPIIAQVRGAKSVPAP